jgi:nucleoside-diphosphate-sugar epimerase
MNVLITGGTGYLGSHIVKALLSSNNQVTVIKRPQSNLHFLQGITDELAYFDSTEEAFSSRQFDAVIHTATFYGVNIDQTATTIDTNVCFSTDVLNNAVKAEVKYFINIDTALNKYINAYALSKDQFREWCKFYAINKKIKVINVPLQHFFGPFDTENKFVSFLMNNCMNNIPEIKLTDGEQIRDFIYIEDAIEALMIVLKVEFEDYYNEIEIGSGIGISIKDFALMVKDLTKSSSELVFGALPYREYELMHSIANIDKVKSFGFSPKYSVEEGINKILLEIQVK